MKPHTFPSRPSWVWLALTLTAALADRGAPAAALTYAPIQTLTQGGTFPVNPLAGDAFGQVVAFNKDYLFVASPGSQPNYKSIAGAVFVYRWNGVQYQPTQIIATGGTGDHLGMLQMVTNPEWLILSVIGTPIGPQANDAMTDQDFRGAVLIYRLNNQNGQWELAQTLDSNTPGLEELHSIEGVTGGIPILGTEQGGNFGLRMALDGEKGWLLVSALYQAGSIGPSSPLINAGKVYAFQLQRSTLTWQLAQTFTNPEGAAMNDAFGASVAVKGRYAMISNGPVIQAPHPNSNSAVYVYRLQDGVWNYVQRLTGTQTGLTPFFFPLASSATVDVGDSFGNAIALGDDHAVISAPLETREELGTVFTGAAYFYQRQSLDGVEQWVFSQKVESDDPNTLAFGLFNVGLNGKFAIVGDMGRTGPAGSYQGGAHVYRRAGNSWEQMALLVDPAGTAGAAFGAGVALGPDGRVAVGASSLLGVFIPVAFRPPPPPVMPGGPAKVIIYQPLID